MNIETASNTTGIPTQHIALWLATIEEGHSPADWDTDAEAYYLNEFIASEPQIIEEHEALPFDEDETEDWEITNISYGRRLIRRTSGR